MAHPDNLAAKGFTASSSSVVSKSLPLRAWMRFLLVPKFLLLLHFPQYKKVISLCYNISKAGCQHVTAKFSLSALWIDIRKKICLFYFLSTEVKMVRIAISLSGQNEGSSFSMDNQSHREEGSHSYAQNNVSE